MHIWVKDALYPSFSTYQRLKFDAAIERLADQLADQFGFVKSIRAGRLHRRSDGGMGAPAGILVH